MKNKVNIAVAIIVASLIVIGGMARYHHHSSDDSICFCTDGLVDLQCEHHHDSDNDEAGGCDHHHDGDADGGCALRLDYFKISDKESIAGHVFNYTLLFAVLAYDSVYDMAIDGHLTYFSFDQPVGEYPDVCPQSLRGPPCIS